MSRVYKNSPITETICQFQFEQDASWDLVIPGLLYEKLHHRFPKRRQVKTFHVNIPFETKLTGALEQRIETIERIQFLNERENAIVQIGAHFLSIHHLQPYPSWKTLHSIIQDGFTHYCEVAQPNNLSQIRLRYINTIEPPQHSMELEEFFHFRPFIGASLPQDFTSFIIGVQLPFDDDRNMLKLQLASAQSRKPDRGSFALILDLDYFTTIAGSVALGEALQWIDDAHARVEDVFEACITDTLRHIFEEEN